MLNASAAPEHVSHGICYWPYVFFNQFNQYLQWSRIIEYTVSAFNYRDMIREHVFIVSFLDGSNGDGTNYTVKIRDFSRLFFLE